MLEKASFRPKRFKNTSNFGQSGDNSQKDQANEVLIESMYQGRLKRTGKLLVGSCPFHDEKKPSFTIYTETNTWNCFGGCGGGDAIKFYMKLHGVDFKTAIEAMSSRRFT